MTPIRADVCVLGGGPAGSTIAQRLATLGHDVVLVEREVAPRPRIGASLPPSAFPLLETIGVDLGAFPRARQIVVWWSTAEPLVRPREGLHVDRAIFDRLLLDHARARGVRVLQPAQAMTPERTDDGWRIPIRDGDDIRARFVVDATGTRGAKRVAPPLLALFAEWEADVDGCVEAGEDEWFWCAPIGEHRAVAAVMLAPQRADYDALIARFRLFRGVRRIGRVHACDATSRYADDAVSPDFLKAGDAAFAMDPLSSQGVQAAIASGLQGAIVVNTLLRRPGDPLPVAFYRDRLREHVQRHAAKTAEMYAERAAVCDRPFWRERATSPFSFPEPELLHDALDESCRIELAARIEPTAIVQGDEIVAAPALHHDALERPLAFLAGVDVVQLARVIRRGDTAASVVRTWSQTVPADLSWRILEWMWQRRVVTASSS